jgi:cation diffusion facilitator CzcD-associated flavoprotein CzcO
MTTRVVVVGGGIAGVSTLAALRAGGFDGDLTLIDTGEFPYEVRHLDLADIKWDLGRFGKLHVRHGKGARVPGPASAWCR